MKPKTTTSRVYNRLSQLLSQKKTNNPDEAEKSLLSDYDDPIPNKGKTFEMKVKKRHAPHQVRGFDENERQEVKTSHQKTNSIVDDSIKPKVQETTQPAPTTDKQTNNQNDKDKPQTDSSKIPNKMKSQKSEAETHLNDSWLLFGKSQDPYGFSFGINLPSHLKIPAVAMKRRP